MSRKYPYDAKGEHMHAHHYRSEHGWRDAYDGSHEGTQRLMNASRAKYGLPPISDDESRTNQTERASLTPSSDGGVALVIFVAVVLLAGAAIGYCYGKKRAEQPKS